MKIILDVKKSIEQNASIYFEKSKKAKKKMQGAMEALEKSKAKKKVLEKKQAKLLAEEEAENVKKQDKRKQEWYEKFRWFYSSEDFLVIGGRDATSNEIVIKKHTEKDDVVFHTDMAGSPFFVVKVSGTGKKPTEKTLQETADATAIYSKAWKLGLTSTKVFYVKPDQVSKEAESGEFVPKGAFMIRGKTTYMHPKMHVAIGAREDGSIMGGSVSAVKHHCEKFVEVQQGNEKTAAIAKKIRSKIGGDLDDIIKVIPAGGSKVKK
jgi:predicted ribosome quality control (RQC) complex YloA/Tae2 family protein